MEAMKIDGIPPQYLGELETIADHESGGNALAVNNTDINAAEGHPSQGLFQMIPSTFFAHELPEYGNIDNGLDNSVSAIRYMLSEYGSISRVPGIVSLSHGGPYIGYENGSLSIPTPGIKMFGEKGPELGWSNQGDGVLNNTNTTALLNIPGTLANLTDSIQKLVTANSGISATAKTTGVPGSGYKLADTINIASTMDIKKFAQQFEFYRAAYATAHGGV
jgi:SLT domain-containing protein